jgi:hypothetical protein
VKLLQAWPALLGGALVAGCGMVTDSLSGKADEAVDVQETATRAVCGPGSKPETDLQGRVPIEERTSGRAEEGYSCNLEFVGQYQGTGASWQHAWYEDCAYYDTSFTGHDGVQVIDASDPANPKRTTNLVTPAMLDPWESLKVNEKRGLLGAVAGWNLGGPVFFDVYDVAGDCKQPAPLASVPMNIPGGHEGNWAPDGMTYYGSLLGTTEAIDVSIPMAPRYISAVFTTDSGQPASEGTHGLAISEDGNRGYFTGPRCGGASGLKILDLSAIQSRAPNPAAKYVGDVCWDDGGTAQHAVPVTIKGKPYVIFVDEASPNGLTGAGAGAARIIDISDEMHPVVISKLKLEIHLMDNETQNQADIGGAGGFGYEGHYCYVDSQVEATVAGCGYFQSGMRVFDIRDPYHPKEIAYFNPPAQRDKALPGSNRFFPTSTGDRTSGYSSAQVRFIKERGEVWFTDQDNGFMVLRFTNGAWPFAE